MGNKHTNGRSGTHHAKTRRRGFPSGETFAVLREGRSYGARGNARGKAGVKRKR